MCRGLNHAQVLTKVNQNHFKCDVCFYPECPGSDIPRDSLREEAGIRNFLVQHFRDTAGSQDDLLCHTVSHGCGKNNLMSYILSLKNKVCALFGGMLYVRKYGNFQHIIKGLIQNPMTLNVNYSTELNRIGINPVSKRLFPKFSIQNQFYPNTGPNSANHLTMCLRKSEVNALKFFAEWGLGPPCSSMDVIALAGT